MEATPSGRRPVIAALLALLCGGLGHAYAGRLPAAVALHLASLAAWTALTLAMRRGFRWAVAAGAVALGLWLAQAALAALAARAAGGERRAWWSRPLGLVALYGVSLVSSGGLRSLLEARVVRTFVMPAGSMMPTLRPGDWIVVAPGAPIERGTVVVHQAPPSSSAPADPLVKRIVAIGGDTVEVRDGRLVLNGEPVPHERLEAPCAYERPVGEVWRFEPCVDIIERLGSRAYHLYCTPFLPCGDVAPQAVPRGQVFVLGDHRDHSADSRVYGPIPERAVVGRAAYIYFSLGPSGIRWSRIGRAVR